MLAALLWTAGLVVLIVKVSGFVSTLAMWPGDLSRVKVNRKGTVREPTAAAAPRERSPTDP